MHKKLFFALLLIALMALVPARLALAQEEDPPIPPTTEKPDNGEIHGIPKYPITVDGVRYEPEEITKFNGQPLHTYWALDSEKEGVLHFFTTKEGIEEHLRARYPDFKGFPDPSSLTQSSDETDSDLGILTLTSNFYKNTYYGGDYFHLYPDQAKWCLIGGWSNAISSLYCSADGGWCNNYDLCFFGGSYLGIQAGSSIPALSVFGWNDKINSILNHAN